jgi:hypothetical protein
MTPHMLVSAKLFPTIVTFILSNSILVNFFLMSLKIGFGRKLSPTQQAPQINNIVFVNQLSMINQILFSYK